MDDSQLARWRREVRAALRGADDDLVEEVTQHVTERWMAAKAEGLSDGAADERVHADLHHWRRTSIPKRPHRRAPLLSGALADMRYGLRSLRARPAMTLAALILTTVAVAATTTAFAIAYGVLWRPLPYPEGHRLAVLWQTDRGNTSQISYPDYADLATLGVFDSAAAMMGGRGSLRVDDTILRVNALEIEAAGYGMLGARPQLGRLLDARDAGQPVAMISHRLWNGALRADPAAIGRVLWLSGRTYTVVGVLPQGFDFELPVTATMKLQDHDVWSVLDPRSPFMVRRDASTYEALVRLSPGTTIDEAQRALDATAARLATSHAATNADRGFRVVSLRNHLTASARAPLLLACVAAFAALMIAVGNLVTLALVRRGERRSELAVRAALGAGTWRLRRQLLIEHVMVTTIGALIGAACATRAVTTLTANEAAALPRADAIRFDSPVVAAAGLATLFIAVVLALCPVGAGHESALRSHSRATRATRRARGMLVAGELAVTVSLTVGGALVALSFARLFATDPGFIAPGAAAMRVSAFQPRYQNLADVERFVHDALARVRERPGVLRAAAGLSLPLSGQTTGTGLAVEGRSVDPAARQIAGWEFITPGYFDTLGMRIVQGRDYVAADRAHKQHVSIINASLARALFGDENPIGRRITSGDGQRTDDWHTIIGVVSDVRHHALDQSPAPRVYDLFGQHWGRTVYVVARAKDGEATGLLPEMRRAIRQVDAEAVVFDASTMPSLVARSAAPYRLSAWLGATLALSSILLALVGVYAVSAASVTERTREIGVRAALGASPRRLVKLILGEGARTACVGMGTGLAGALVAARLLRSQLFDVQVSDLTVLVPLAAVSVLLAALAATLPAARRAAHADPLIAMKSE